MSDKLKLDFDLYYTEADNFNAGYNARKHGVETDKLLSRAGKFEQVEKIKTEHLNNVNNLGERFNTDFGDRLNKIDDYVNDRRPDPVLDSIKKRFTKGETLSSEETNKLLITELRENKLLTRKSNFQNMLNGVDNKQLKNTAQALIEAEDVEKLEWVQESVSTKGDTLTASSLQAQINGIRDSTMTDEKKNLQEISKRIQKGVELFNYTLERLKTGIFVDARQDEVQ